MIQKLNRRQAASIMHSLAESGQPPKLGATVLNVGTERFLTRLHDQYFSEHLLPYDGVDGGGACKWIEADYGNGKTQFLRCAQELAWEKNFVSAFVELSQDECPLDRPELVYTAIARSLQAKPLTAAEVDTGRGIESTFSQLFDRMYPGILSGTPNEDLIKNAEYWLENTLMATPVESASFTKAVSLMLNGKLRGESADSRLAAAYLRGEAVPPGELKSIGIYEKLDKSSGFRILRTLCQLLQRSGLATGVVLLFDEARRSLSLMSSKSQKIACENLLTVINKCNSGDFPGTLFLYAVMPEFFTDFASQYAALQSRCGPATRFRLNKLEDIGELELLQRIGRKMVDIFRIANPDVELPNEDDEVLRANLQIAAEEVLRKSMGNATRRLMVKTWAQLLQQSKESGLQGLSAEIVVATMDGVQRELEIAEAAAAVSSEE